MTDIDTTVLGFPAAEDASVPAETASEKQPAEKQKKPKKMRENLAFRIVNYILLTLVILICLVPFLTVVAKSFSTDTGKAVYLIPNKFTLFNYKYVFTDWGYYRALFISVIVTVGGTLLSVMVMFSAAYALSKEEFPLRKGVMTYFLIIMLFSGGIVPNFFVMKTLGLTNTIFALIFPAVVQVYNLILLKNYLEGVPKEIEESAHIDGAKNIQVMFLIMLPISMPSVASVALFTAVTYWNNYFNALIYLLGSTGESLYPLARYILNYINMSPDPLGDQVLFHQKFFIEAAMILVSIIPILAVYPFVSKFFVKGVTVGSVKG